MKAKLFLVAVALVAAALLSAAFVPGVQSRLFPDAESSFAEKTASIIEAFSGPTPTPEPSLREVAQKKLGWLDIKVEPASLHRSAADMQYYVTGLLLTAGVDIDELDAQGRTPLLIALEEKDGKMVNLLLEQGADPNAVGEGRAAPLIVAAQAGNLEWMRQLLKAGADVDATDADGRTVLHRMVENGQEEEFDLLLEEGADWRREGPMGATPLQAALRLGHEQMAKKLFALDNAPREEWTPFMREMLAKALKSGNEPMAQLLIAHHPGLPKPQGATQSLLAYSVAWNDLNMFKTLLACGADPNERLAIPAERKFIDAVNEEDLVFYLQNEHGMTVLMLAAALGRLEFVDELLKHGADKLARTEKYKMVAMSFAQRSNQTRTILLLMGKNPDPSTHTTRIAISLSNQQAVFYQDGVAVFRTPVSTGKENFRTPTGEFVITDKHRSRVSSIYEVEMPYFMRLNGSGYGMHEGYVPSYPASHGCIRLPRKAARRLFKEAAVGTYVTISE